MSDLLFPAGFSLTRTLVVLTAVAVLAGLDLLGRAGKKRTRFAFGAVVGTILSVGSMEVTKMLLADSAVNGYAMALGVLLLIVVWRILFGTWDAGTKATVLGTFLFWIVFQMLMLETGTQRLAHLIAIGVAVIPAAVWAMIFLPYHRERLSVVLGMLFSGMLSTIPILLYDALQQRGIALDFFLFRVELVSFNRSAHAFVADVWPSLSTVGLSVMTVLVAFLCVGLIEEGSKFWVLKRGGERHITSVDDAMQLAILTAIGFAFAENITPTGYFVDFVKQYLLDPVSRDWVSFAGNVAGRSILTSMVHIVSTGIIGYFLGLAIFAGPSLQNAEAKGRKHRVLRYIHDLFGMRKEMIVRRQMLLTGFGLAILLHASSNFLVTLPDILPGNPRTLGDIFGSAPGSPLHYVALLLFPTLFYVVGGFFLLTYLFARAENQKEWGHNIQRELFVAEEEAEVE